MEFQENSKVGIRDVRKQIRQGILEVSELLQSEAASEQKTGRCLPGAGQYRKDARPTPASQSKTSTREAANTGGPTSRPSSP